MMILIDASHILWKFKARWLTTLKSERCACDLLVKCFPNFQLIFHFRDHLHQGAAILWMYKLSGNRLWCFNSISYVLMPNIFYSYWFSFIVKLIYDISVRLIFRFRLPTTPEVRGMKWELLHKYWGHRGDCTCSATRSSVYICIHTRSRAPCVASATSFSLRFITALLLLEHPHNLFLGPGSRLIGIHRRVWSLWERR